MTPETFDSDEDLELHMHLLEAPAERLLREERLFQCSDCGSQIASLWGRSKHRRRCQLQLRREEEERVIEAYKVPLAVAILMRPLSDIGDHRPSLVTPRFWVSGEGPATDVAFITSENIAAVVVCACDLVKLTFPHSVKVLKCLALDTEQEPILEKYLGGVISFLATIPADSNVLFCCREGKSRSVTLLLGYLIKVERMTLFDAFRRVKGERECARPNKGFLEQLINFEKQELQRESSIPIEAILLHTI